MKRLSLKTFLRKYPNDESCLEEIFNKKYPDGVFCIRCKKLTAHFKITGRLAYSCTYCRKQVSPLTDTIFEQSSVPLRLWFYAIFLITKTRSGISAKQLERELGVCYKTAHRMFKLIRRGMDDSGGERLKGDVEIDETFVGGKGRNRRYVNDFQAKQKEIIMGMLERKGRVIPRHIESTGRIELFNEIKTYIDPQAHIITDQYNGYRNLRKQGYNHDSVNHMETYVIGSIHTNTIEGFWSNFKRGLYGVYRHCDSKYLLQYANEYAFRYNNRELGDGMFDKLLTRVVSVGSVGA
jgi:transposase-like protein